ncbi:MAG: hypothetical protein KIT31_04715 [Deltaproteobacteria bacterium]|nr:hypothetical protein [Deltaproteobacteria bacterium]
MRVALAVALLVAACGDPPPPVDVANGRLVARIHPDPAQIELLLDGRQVWTTRAGGSAPLGFLAYGNTPVAIEHNFGSFKFVEDEREVRWHAVTELSDIRTTADGAELTLIADGERIGTGKLTFVAATRSGPAPDAAGFARHVRMEFALDAGARVSLGASLAQDEHLVGLGGQSFDVDHRGETVPLWVQEDGIGKFPDPDDVYTGIWFLTGRKHSTHTPMPMLLSSRGYALAVDTDARAVFALGSEDEGVARYEAWDRRLDLQVFVGDGAPGEAVRDAFGHMIAWTGKPPRPPLSIFAPWVDALFGSANVRAVANALRANGIASSVIWTEDFRGGANGITGYALDEDWRVDRDLYPDFEALAGDLRARGFAFHTYANTFLDETADVYAEAVAGGYAIKDAAGGAYTFTGVKFTPSTLLDLSNPDAFAWAKGVLGQMRDQGADGWMADFAEWLPHDAVLASGEPAMLAHNRYPVDWARMNREMFEAPIAGRPDPIWFMRSAWLHSQPQVQVMWAGDQQTDFSDGDGYPSVIPIGLGLGLTGFPYFGSDVGGYMSQGTTPTTSELFQRWVTLGALTPVMRTHHGRSAAENVQWNRDATTIAHFRRWTRIHAQLAAYLWGSIGAYERDGLPLMRLIALDYPDETWAWTDVTEYLLGDRILVAPILATGATSRRVKLPAGAWIPLLGGVHVTGDNTATAAVTEIPAFVPAGAILVLYPDGLETVLDAPASPATLTVNDVGADREVWLYPGEARVPAHAGWHDDTGAVGAPQWTWSGRPLDAGAATAATFNGAPVAVAGGAVTVTGDGTLAFAGGGTLTIARGRANARTTVRLR